LEVKYPALKFGQRFFCPKPPSGLSDKLKSLISEKKLLAKETDKISRQKGKGEGKQGKARQGDTFRNLALWNVM
jgi:hypothetical protein